MTDTETSDNASDRTNPCPPEPFIERSITLNFMGDWGQANFHRICSWLTQEFCDRSGPSSRTAIWSVRGGGIEALQAVHNGEIQVSVATPAKLMPAAITGEGIFPYAMPGLRALAVLPQNDRMVLAISPKFGVKSFEELRKMRLPLRIATSTNDGTNFIGYTAAKYMEAHGISEEALHSWGGSYVTQHRPEQSLFRAQRGEVDAVLQEAIMTPWWRDVIEKHGWIALPAEAKPLEVLYEELSLPQNPLPVGFWKDLDTEMPALDFSDFVIVVRDDLPEDIAYLLTWCLVETREAIERQYHHIPPERSPLSYPLNPKKMANPPLPLHPGAKRYYQSAKYLESD